jgi:hypothetical protein
MRTEQTRFFLLGAGAILLVGGSVRFYRVIRTHTKDAMFAPHLLLISLSLLISWKVLRIGMDKSEKTRKDAISLIRSGSVLMMIWAYRLFLLLTSTVQAAHFKSNAFLAVLYVVIGAAVMGAGLWISRRQRPLRD